MLNPQGFDAVQMLKKPKTQVINCSPKIPSAQIGAVSFIQRFGATLNLHPHFHLIVADGVFEAENTKRLSSMNTDFHGYNLPLIFSRSK